MKNSLNVDWTKVINTLSGPFPEIGIDAPDQENISKIKDPKDIIGNVTRLTLDIFVFDNDDLEQAYMMQNENMKIYQSISLKDCMLMVERGKKKKS